MTPCPKCGGYIPGEGEELGPRAACKCRFSEYELAAAFVQGIETGQGFVMGPAVRVEWMHYAESLLRSGKLGKL